VSNGRRRAVETRGAWRGAQSRQDKDELAEAIDLLLLRLACRCFDKHAVRFDIHAACLDIHPGTFDIHAACLDIHPGTFDIHAACLDIQNASMSKQTFRMSKLNF